MVAKTPDEIVGKYGQMNGKPGIDIYISKAPGCGVVRQNLHNLRAC